MIGRVMGNAENDGPSGRNGPAQGHNRLERTTGFEPATLTLAKVTEVMPQPA